MKIGTKSLLYGAHQFAIHPWFVAWAWWRLFGFPYDPRLWIAFVIHDWGYWGKPNMDGPEGEDHVLFAAHVMRRFFGWRWYWFCVCHSRFWAKKRNVPVSRLCVADKLAITLTPAWLYLPLVRLTGEIDEYMALAKMRTVMGEPKYASMNLVTDDGEEQWYADVQEYLRRWVAQHKDGGADTWTPAPSSQDGAA